MTIASAGQPRGAIEEALDGVYETFALATDEETLLGVFGDCFEEWRHIHVGPVIQGAVWEVRPPRKPRIAMLDGYATFDFGDWHAHVCIGEHKGATPELAVIRRTGKAELYRMLTDGTPSSWGFRCFNGAGEQQATILLPHPYLTDKQQVTREPDWDRLQLWDGLRLKYLGLGPDPLDRSLTGFRHG